MRTLITALAVAAILANSAFAKAERTKQIASNPTTSRVQLNDSYCHFHTGQTDPIPEFDSSL
jgi:hypothetical protein